MTASSLPLSPPTAPEWDLSDLYADIHDLRIASDLDGAAHQADGFRRAWQGRLTDASPDALAEAIHVYEGISQRLSRVASYAQLIHAADVENPEYGRFYQDILERTADIERDLLFFGLELNRLDDATLAKALAASPALRRYQPWLDQVRAFRPHQLDDKLEELLHDKDVTGKSAWVRLFDQTMAALRFPYQGQELTETELLHILSTSKDEAARREAALTFGRVLKDNERLFALITNTLAKDKATEDRWRNFSQPVHARNLANQIENEAVEALASTVRAAYPRLSHRYYALKAKWLGKTALNFWDRNAPLPEQDDRVTSWDEARAIVLSAYGRFSPELAQVGERFFDARWIDAAVRPGKDSGAFSHPVTPDTHPYILMNYQGKTRDIMTLAHELGHGVHQVLAARQGYLLSHTPLTLAETASVFGEMLTFQALLAQTADPRRRKVMLAGKVEDMLNTVVRQIAFHHFETRLHDQRRAGELSADAIAGIWMETQAESFGPAIVLGEAYQNYWSYIPHFIHTPFYVYAYAFGDCLVNALYGVYEQAGAGFAARYLTLLQAGGSKRYDELLAPFGLDARDPGFWNRGLAVIERMIAELETLP
jgi:oligoendopeptidase F